MAKCRTCGADCPDDYPVHRNAAEGIPRLKERIGELTGLLQDSLLYVEEAIGISSAARRIAAEIQWVVAERQQEQEQQAVPVADPAVAVSVEEVPGGTPSTGARISSRKREAMQMDKQHVVSLQGKDYVLWSGVLAEGHERGLQSIEVELVQIPTEENGHTAIMRATVTMKDGTQFSDYGDANPRNTNARIATALLRMASTRAKGRALRDAINVGQTLVEELPDLEEQAAHTPTRNGHATPHAAARAREATAAGSAPSTPTRTGFEPEFRQGTSTKTYRRTDLLAGAKALIEQAESLGIEHEAIEPEQTPNEGLLSFGLGLKPKVAAAVAAAQAHEMAAETS